MKIALEKLIDDPRLANVPTLASLLQDPNAETDSAAYQETEAAWSALKTSIQTNGVREPISVIPHPDHEDRYIVVDGRNRSAASKSVGLQEIEARIVKETEALDLIRETVVCRRHFSKGAKAYFAVVMNPGVFKSKGGGDRKSLSLSESDQDPTLTKLAADYGVSIGLLSEAKEFALQIKRLPEARAATYLSSLWLGDASLRGLLQGLASELAPGPNPAGKPGSNRPAIPPSTIISSFNRSFLDGLPKLGAGEREDVKAGLIKNITATTPERRDEVKTGLQLMLEAITEGLTRLQAI